MYVEEVCIDGFKSYAQRTVVPAFDPLFNAITGLNGSGKSNILDAICFVLGITNLSQVRRRVRATKNVLFPFARSRLFQTAQTVRRSSFRAFRVFTVVADAKPEPSTPRPFRSARRLSRSSCTSKARRA